jgi:hypothetical protein
MDPGHYLQDAVSEFRKLKILAEKAVAQVAEADLLVALDSDSNSIAVVMKHMAGNMRSRWTDFLTSDGEKPDRNRDSEFVIEPEDTRKSILERWEAGWCCVFGAIEPLTSGDLERTVSIRGKPHSVLEAIQRQLTHYAYHVGQIVFLAKHFAAEKWQTLSVRRGKSEAFNASMRKRTNRA